MTVKGISLNIGGDGSVSYTPGYKVEPSPFDKIKALIEQYKKSQSKETLDKIHGLVHGIPDPDRPATWIGLAEVKILKEYWELCAS